MKSRPITRKPIAAIASVATSSCTTSDAPIAAATAPARAPAETMRKNSDRVASSMEANTNASATQSQAAYVRRRTGSVYFPGRLPGSDCGLCAPSRAAPVDVEQKLTEIHKAKGSPNLNWRTSIADLMRLLDLDPSLENREELATELGYTGAKDGSAEMNIWLYKRVMAELEKNGGVVPAALKG